MEKKTDFPANRPVAPCPENLRRFSGFTRLILVLLALLVTGYGLDGLVTDDLHLPARRGPGIHYHGAAATLMTGMIVSIAGFVATVAFAKFDAVRRRITRPLLPTILFMSTFIFMIAGILVNASSR